MKTNLGDHLKTRMSNIKGRLCFVWHVDSDAVSFAAGHRYFKLTYFEDLCYPLRISGNASSSVALIRCNCREYMQYECINLSNL